MTHPIKQPRNPSDPDDRGDGWRRVATFGATPDTAQSAYDAAKRERVNNQCQAKVTLHRGYREVWARRRQPKHPIP